MCAANRSCAHPKTVTGASCALRWTFSFWKPACWTRESNRSLPRRRIGAVSLSLTDLLHSEFRESGTQFNFRFWGAPGDSYVECGDSALPANTVLFRAFVTAHIY